MIKGFLLMMLATTMVFGQKEKQDSIWSPVKQLIGNWKGEGGGEPGIGKYERSYQFILSNNFIEINNKSTYPPTNKNPKGEVHEDIGYIIYDRARKAFLLRQLHTEGFVNDYVLTGLSADKKTMVFESESIVNIPKGWRARETYRLLSDNEFEETFELAPPDKEFAVYTRVKLTKQH